MPVPVPVPVPQGAGVACAMLARVCTSRATTAALPDLSLIVYVSLHTPPGAGTSRQCGTPRCRATGQAAAQAGCGT